MAQAQLSISPDNLGGIPEDLPIEQQQALVEAAVRRNPPAAASLALMFLNQKHQYKILAEERGRQLELIAAAPWTPATLLARIREDWAMVSARNHQVGVAIGPKVNRAALVPGCHVLLNREQSAIVELGPPLPRTGVVGRFSRRHETQAVIRGPSDEELVVHLPAALRDIEFANGDLILYDREGMIALERVATRHEHANLLEEVRGNLRISDLGALDEIFQNILEDVLICFLHGEVAARHQLEPVRSIMLIGPPGVGKTSLIQCVATALAERLGVRVRVLLVRPSIHRSKWYGESEEKVRAIFDEVKRALREDGGYIVLFFDDVDQLGSRDTMNDVDARVLPAFLHEVEALRGVDRVMLVAATNKPELLDPALARAGRFGDREYRVPRPGTREASGQILRCYLGAGVPCRCDGRAAAPADLVEDALSAMYSPNGELATLAKLFFRDGSSQALTPAMVVSGAVLRNSVGSAKQRACRRELRGGPGGVTSEDLLGALAAEFANITHRLKPGPALHALLDFPDDLDVVRVEARNGHPSRRQYMRPPVA